MAAADRAKLGIREPPVAIVIGDLLRLHEMMDVVRAEKRPPRDLVGF